MNEELKHKLEPLRNRIELRKVIIKNYQEALIKGMDYSLELKTTNWIKRLQHEIKDFEKQERAVIKRYEKTNS